MIKPLTPPNGRAHLHRRQESRQLWKTGMPPGSGAATCSVPLLLASHLLPSERLCERDGEAIGIDAYSKPDALVYLLSRCQDKMCASCLQFPMRGCEILNRKADRACPCQRLWRRLALTTDARSFQVKRERGGASLKLAPPGRLEFQRQAEDVAVERDRAAHVRNVDFDVIDFAEHHAPLCDGRAP